MLYGYKIIALCISRLNDERNFNFTKAVNDAALSHGYRLFVYHTCSDLYWNTANEDGEKSIFSLMNYDILDAVILFDEAFWDKDMLGQIARHAQSRNIPVISVGAERDGCCCFTFDYESGFEQIVRHVVEFHHAKKIHFIAGRKDEVSSERRIAVFRKVLAENKIAFSENDLSYGDYWHGPTTDAVLKLIAQDRVPDAIICANDMMAVTACEVLADHDIHVPSDVIVTGFDGTNEARIFVPPITTCKCNLTAAGTQIVDAIHLFFEGGTPSMSTEITYEPDIYDSCGCPNPHGVLNMGLQLRKAEDRFHSYQDTERLLYKMSEKIFTCGSIQEMITCFSEHDFPKLSIVVNRQVTDPAVNPVQNTNTRFVSDDMILLYQNNVDKNLFPMPFRCRDVIKTTEFYIASQNPIIFTSLVFMGIAFGYIAFFFPYDFKTCCKIPQYISTLDNAIGGFRNIRHVQFIAKHDYMTGLYNRNGFYAEAEQLIREHDGSRFMMVSADVDGLKYINDTFGHDSGDFVIREAANALRSCRAAAKVCGRFGGDELVLCAALGEEEDGEAMLRADIKAYVDSVNSRPDKKFDLSISVGVCISEPGSGRLNLDSLLKVSDELMYQEKITKPNRRKR